MIQLRTVDFVLLVVSSFVAGGLFGWGVNVLIWLDERRRRRDPARPEWTPTDDDWLDTWGICP